MLWNIQKSVYILLQEMLNFDGHIYHLMWFLNFMAELKLTFAQV